MRAGVEASMDKQAILYGPARAGGAGGGDGRIVAACSGTTVRRGRQHGDQLGAAAAGDGQCCAGSDGRPQAESDQGRAHYVWLLQRTQAGAFTLRGLVAELAERGLKVDYRSVWSFVH